MADSRSPRRRRASVSKGWNSAGVGAVVAGAAGAIGLAWVLGKLWKTLDETDRPAAALSGERAPGWSGQSGGGHGSAGPDSMRDPPKTWSSTDQAVDESFPASDPAPTKPHID